ncbi:MAG: hypothetical protein HRT44_12650, partial [Bdellovibrionales bacterium]|nr:hypothetical protein [Bdellovibrionales bacterium]NQZ20087.1 hypothetical protein [Bdellovibrionales bacterium]
MWWIPAAHAETFMPPAATKIAEEINTLYGFLLISSLISFIILMGGMSYFIYNLPTTKGVRVSSVRKNGSAAKAKINSKQVITHINNQPIFDEEDFK